MIYVQLFLFKLHNAEKILPRFKHPWKEKVTKFFSYNFVFITVRANVIQLLNFDKIDIMISTDMNCFIKRIQNLY